MDQKKTLADPNWEHLSGTHKDLTTSIKQALASPVLLMNLEEDHDIEKVEDILLGDAEKDDLLNLAHKIKKSSKKHALKKKMMKKAIPHAKLLIL